MDGTLAMSATPMSHVQRRQRESVRDFIIKAPTSVFPSPIE